MGEAGDRGQGRGCVELSRQGEALGANVLNADSGVSRSMGCSALPSALPRWTSARSYCPGGGVGRLGATVISSSAAPTAANCRYCPNHGCCLVVTADFVAGVAATHEQESLTCMRRKMRSHRIRVP